MANRRYKTWVKVSAPTKIEKHGSPKLFKYTSNESSHATIFENISLVPYNYCCPKISAVENTEFYGKSVPNLEKSEKVLGTVAIQSKSRELIELRVIALVVT